MGDAARARKVADRIKVVVADFLEFRIRDERLGFVTITDVRVTGDLQNATVFSTVLGGDPERAATAAALESNTGRIRSVVGKALGIRLTPTIAFVADALPEGAAYLEGVIEATKARDAELAKAAASARYAGEPDPYRRAADDAADGEPETQPTDPS